MSDLEEEYRLDYFEEHDMVRHECESCGDHFWTRDRDRRTCGEPPCGEYTFIDDPGFDREFTLEEMREQFLSFFEARGHGRLEPYPVAANRWRDDVLLTQASIYDFQHHVTSGKTPPPANPLTVSQPCIRMQDIDNVGVTGRHTMAFEMMAHHAFNTVENVSEDRYAYHGEVYWKDRTVEYCDELLETVGVDLDEVVYIEDPWTGGGNAGPALEVIYRGAEVATLVFMSMEADPDGEYELKGERYTPMDRYVVDTGYGLERWTWVSQGTPTVYEAVYPDTIAFLRENAGLSYDDEEDAVVAQAARLAGKMDIDEAEDVEAARADIAREVGVSVDRLRELVEPLESVYAIADHCRTLAYMLGDGIVPSNVGSGYLARMVLRRTKRLADDVGVDAPLDELVDMQAERLGYENRDTVRDVVRTEIESYRETLERGESRVTALADEYAAREEPIPVEELVELYDSHGVHPDTVEEMVAGRGVAVEQPDDFLALVASRHEGGQVFDETDDDRPSDLAGAGIEDRLVDLPETERLYYEDQSGTEFEAVVLDSFERDVGEEDGTVHDVVLDGTMFYPESGGQPADEGVLSGEDASADVGDVQVHDGVVVHRVDAELDAGEIVRGQVDADRRRQLMRNHTATHVVIHAAREVLGDHVRQAGAQKGTDSSRVDLRHYRRVSREEVKAIERVANDVVTGDVSVRQEFVDRHEAETEHGFDLYQGGVPAGEQLRLVHVAEDVQACGGTHVARTGEVGTIKILRTEPVQDGVERFVFAAGPAAVEATQRTEDALYEAADTLDVSPPEVPAAAARFFEEWKGRGKRIDDLQDEIAALRASGGDDGESVEVGETTAVVRRIDADMDELRATANAVVEDGDIAVLGSGADGAQFVVAVPDGVGVNAGEVVGRLAEIVGGGGGGPPDFAQGGGPDADAVDDALAAAPDALRAALNA